MPAESAILQLAPAPAPAPAHDLAAEELLDLYAIGTTDPWLRVNFIASIDGAASAGGLSGGLQVPADTIVFDLLRRPCDVVVVAAGTVRAEGYGPMVLEKDSVLWREAHGFASQPVFAIVTGSLDFEPGDPIFRDAPVRPLILTTESAPDDRRRNLNAVADVVDVGVDRVDPQRLVATLEARGLGRIHCEGGPSFFGDLIAAGVVDEVCLTVSPLLAGGTAPRIAHGGGSDTGVPMTLAHVLTSDGALLLRYTRPSRSAYHAAASASASMIV